MIKVKKIENYENELKDEEEITCHAFFEKTPMTNKSIKNSHHLIGSIKSLHQREV